MLTNVYTTPSLHRLDNKLLWAGRSTIKYNVGDIIFIGDGWGGQPIKQAYYDLNDDTQELYLDDSTNEFRNHVERYGLFSDNKGEHHE